MKMFTSCRDTSQMLTDILSGSLFHVQTCGKIQRQTLMLNILAMQIMVNLADVGQKWKDLNDTFKLHDMLYS